MLALHIMPTVTLEANMCYMQRVGLIQNHERLTGHQVWSGPQASPATLIQTKGPDGLDIPVLYDTGVQIK